MHSYTLEEARSIVMRCAKQYRDNLLDKTFIIIYRDRVDKVIKFLEIYFGAENYQHLTGIELLDKDGNVNFCLGLIQAYEKGCYVPASTLLEDIKNLTNEPSQVLAIFSKEKSEMLYKKIRHVAKGLNLSNIKLSKEITDMISLEEYMPKGNVF